MHRVDQWASCKAAHNPTHAEPREEHSDDGVGSHDAEVFPQDVARLGRAAHPQLGLLKNTSLLYGVSQFNVSLIKLTVRG